MHYHKVWQRYPHDAEALKPQPVRAAEEALDVAMRKKLNFRAAWAYVAAKAAGGDAEAQLLLELVK